MTKKSQTLFFKDQFQPNSGPLDYKINGVFFCCALKMGKYYFTYPDYSLTQYTYHSEKGGGGGKSSKSVWIAVHANRHAIMHTSNGL